MSVRSELRRNRDESFSWLRLGPVMLGQLSDLPLDALKVFEKIGEELGEFQDEIIKAKSPEDLSEEAVDLLVTSMAAVEAFLRMAQSSGAGTAFFGRHYQPRPYHPRHLRPPASSTTCLKSVSPCCRSLSRPTAGWPETSASGAPNPHRRRATPT